MNTEESRDVRRGAFNNIVSALNIEVTLPERVFTESWTNFLFFPSDNVFTEKFVDVIRDLLDIENAKVCCLINLSQTSSFEFETIAAIFLDKEITGEIYDAKLRGDEPSVGWLYQVDSYACASDVGGWCIYCDKENDIAVIGFRNGFDNEYFRLPMKNLGAWPIEDVVVGGCAPIFPFDQLTSEWLSKLIENYRGK